MISSTWAYTTKDDSSVRILMLKEEVENEAIWTYLKGPIVCLIPITVNDYPVREFRNAWAMEETKLGVNNAKARAIIRTERTNTLKKLDILSLAVERSKDLVAKQVLEKEAKRLRDIPQSPEFNLEDTDKLVELLEQAKEITI